MFCCVFSPLSKVEQLKQTIANLLFGNEWLTAQKRKREGDLFFKEYACRICPIEIITVPAVKQCLVKPLTDL